MGDSSDGKPNSQSKDPGWFDRFKQQQNSAWTPRYTASSISPMLIGFGVLLVPLGIAMLVVTSDGPSDMKEMRIDYTHCSSVKNASTTCAQFIRTPASWTGDPSEVCQCEVQFRLDKPIKGKKLYMYYTLDNFHQNIRRYGSSRDNNQLKDKIGTAENPKNPSKDCAPLDKDSNGKIYYPCGSVANSMFNDSIQLYYNSSELGLVKIQQQRRGIAWSSDIKYRFKNPSLFYKPEHPIWSNFTKPRDWSRTLWDLDKEDPQNNGVQNEDLIVWMRTAAFSNFRKLYRIIVPSDQPILGDGLPAGKYFLRINYTYEVASFGGRKGVLLSSTTIFGQQNFYQGIASTSVGGISIVLGLLLLLCGCNNRLGKGSFTKSRNPAGL